MQSQFALQQQHQQLPPVTHLSPNMMTLANQQQVQQLTQMLSNTQMHGHAHQPAQAAAAQQQQQQQQPVLQQQQQQQHLTNDYIKAQWEAIKMEKLKIEREREEIARKVLLTSLPYSYPTC